MVIALLAMGCAIHAGGAGATNPLAHSQWEPIVVSGKLELANDQYLFYRPANAETVNP